MAHPLMLGAAVAVIVASGVGVAAITGYLPRSTAQETASAGATATTTPAPAEPAKPRQVAAVSRPCVTCGVVMDVKEVQVKGEGTGLGAVAGGAVGAVVGNQFGRGDGRTVMTVAGGVGGALAGNEIEKHARSGKRYDINVRMQGGRIATVSSDTAPAWKAGDRVRVANGKIEPR